MEFDKDHKVKFETLNEDEARAFLYFLEDEKYRHIEDVESASDMIEDIKRHGNDNSRIDSASIEFEESAIARHQDDIKDIDKLIEKVKDKFGL